MLQKNEWVGLFLFMLGSLLYTLNQTIKLMLFANVASEVIYTIICFILICSGIACFTFEEFGGQIVVGVLSILLLFFMLNAILLVIDSFTTFRYASTNYFTLLLNSIDLGEIVDERAILMIAIAPSLGILFWLIIARNDSPRYYWLAIFAGIIFLETWIFAAIAAIPIF